MQTHDKLLSRHIDLEIQAKQHLIPP